MRVNGKKVMTVNFGEDDVEWFEPSKLIVEPDPYVQELLGATKEVDNEVTMARGSKRSKRRSIDPSLQGRDGGHRPRGASVATNSSEAAKPATDSVASGAQGLHEGAGRARQHKSVAGAASEQRGGSADRSAGVCGDADGKFLTRQLVRDDLRIIMTFTYDHYRYVIFYKEHIVSAGSGTGREDTTEADLNQRLDKFMRQEWSTDMQGRVI
jgi:hypothetical protein